MRVDENGSVSFDSNAGFIGGLKRAFTLPGDVSAGRYDIEPETPGQISDYDLARQQANNDEIFSRLGDLSSLITLKSAPTVVPSSRNRLSPRIQDKDDDPEDVINDSESATVTLFIPDTVFRVHYRFRRDSRCWFLYGISDRST